MRWRSLLAGLVVLSACTSSSTASSSGAFPRGGGRYAAVTEPPSGWVLDAVHLGRDAGLGGRPLEATSVFTVDGRPGNHALVASVVPLTWGHPSSPVDLGPTADGREAVPAAEVDHLWVHVDDHVLEVWGRDVTTTQVRAFAARVTVDRSGAPTLDQPVDRFRLLAALPADWDGGDRSTSAVLRRGERREWLTILSLDRRALAALRLLLLDDPAPSFGTQASLYDPDRYPKLSTARVAGRAAHQGMLSRDRAALVVPGDPGIAILTFPYSAPAATRGLDVARRVAASLERLDRGEVVELRDRIAGEHGERELHRVVGARDVLWHERRGGVERSLVLDPTPRYAGPDPARLRNRPAACLVVALRDDAEVPGSDGCLAPEPVLSVGDGSAPTWRPRMRNEVFALADDRVARVELRSGGRVVAVARRVELDRRIDGRRQLFLFGQRSTSSGQRLVALDADGEVLREVTQARGFAAYPVGGRG